MIDQDISGFLTNRHNQLVKPVFNEYVKIMNNNEMPKEHKLAEVIYALTRFTNVLKDYIEKAKHKTVLEMQGTGTLGYKTENLNVSLIDTIPSCIIQDAKMIERQYPELMIPPKPNKTEIAKRLRRGETINGAVLDNGGPPHIRISPIKKTTNPYAKGGENE